MAHLSACHAGDLITSDIVEVAARLKNNISAAQTEAQK